MVEPLQRRSTNDQGGTLDDVCMSVHECACVYACMSCAEKLPNRVTLVIDCIVWLPSHRESFSRIPSCCLRTPLRLGCSSSGQVGPYRTPGPLVPLRTPSYIMQPSLSPLANRDDEPSSNWYRFAFLYFVGACMSHLIETY